MNRERLREDQTMMEEPLHSSPRDHANDTMSYAPPSTSFDTNIIIITSVLLLLLICVLAINGIIKYALNWPRVRSIRYIQRAHGLASPAHTLPCGINKSRLKLLPTFIYRDDDKNHVNMKEVSRDRDPISSSSSSSSSSQCPICLSDFKDGEEVRVLPKCRHAFHIKCVDTWFAKHSSCPTCRADLNHALKLDPEMTTRASQVQVRIVITSSGDATPSIYRVLPPPSSQPPPPPQQQQQQQNQHRLREQPP